MGQKPRRREMAMQPGPTTCSIRITSSPRVGRRLRAMASRSSARFPGQVSAAEFSARAACCNVRGARFPARPRTATFFDEAHGPNPARPRERSGSGANRSRRREAPMLIGRRGVNRKNGGCLGRYGPVAVDDDASLDGIAVRRRQRRTVDFSTRRRERSAARPGLRPGRQLSSRSAKKSVPPDAGTATGAIVGDRLEVARGRCGRPIANSRRSMLL